VARWTGPAAFVLRLTAPLIGDGRNAGAAQWKVAMRAPVRSGYPFELQSG